MREVDNLTCDHCRHWNPRPEVCQCRCIDHSFVHFSRPWFSCDVCTGKHSICSAFEPWPYYPAAWFDWYEHGGWDGWYPLYVEQWLNGKPPKQVPLILARKPQEGREFSDDKYMVPYEDFISCNIMRPDGIHYEEYHHIERSRKSVTGYVWITEPPGILLYDI